MVVNFEWTSFVALNVLSNENGKASPQGTLEVLCGEGIILTAEPDEGYDFFCWTDLDGNEISRANPHLFYVVGNSTVIANFINLSIKENSLTSFVVSPNPTSSTATVSFDLLSSGHLEITLIDLLGNKLQTLFSGFSETKTFRDTFNFQIFPSGSYYLRIEHNGKSIFKKIILE
jgi:hypothetical protein